MRTIELEKSGYVECLCCHDRLIYGDGLFGICFCGNISIQNNVLMNSSNKHDYLVKPDYFINNAKKTIVVDLDDTLAKNEWPFIGEPNIPLIKHLINMIDSGYYVVLDTCRMNPDIVGGQAEVNWHRLEIKAFLKKYALEQVEILERNKPYGVVVWDDKSSNPLNKNILGFLA